MTQIIIEMARQAGAEFAELPMMDAIVFAVDDRAWNSKELEAFAELVRADEREACAKVCDGYSDGRHANMVDLCAESIRARGQA